MKPMYLAEDITLVFEDKSGKLTEINCSKLINLRISFNECNLLDSSNSIEIFTSRACIPINILKFRMIKVMAGKMPVVQIGWNILKNKLTFK